MCEGFKNICIMIVPVSQWLIMKLPTFFNSKKHLWNSWGEYVTKSKIGQLQGFYIIQGVYELGRGFFSVM